jgi:hypothetical protein
MFNFYWHHACYRRVELEAAEARTKKLTLAMRTLIHVLKQSSPAAI